MSYLCEVSRSALIIVDLQEKLMPVIAEGPDVVKRALIIAKVAKLRRGVPGWHGPILDHFRQGRGPVAGLSKGGQREWPDLSLPMAHLTVLGQDRGDVARVRHMR